MQSAERRHTLVNLSMTLSFTFLLLKDLHRNRLAGKLTGASADPGPWYCEEKYRIGRYRRRLRCSFSGSSHALTREAGTYLTDFSASQ
jgi:hypothetical protein